MYETKSSGVAAVLSALFNGLGQIYNGQLFKGIMIIIIQAINAALMTIFIGFITFPIVWLYSVFDAYGTAKRINDRAWQRRIRDGY